ncbi:MAG: helical backbone metal receptor [Myxococcota bacterium]
MAGRGARKPEHQWSTRRAAAVRREHDAVVFEDDPRAEAFDLVAEDGTQLGIASLGLTGQVVDKALADDPELPYAVKCWLAARGSRSVALTDEDGWTLAQGPIAIESLGEETVTPAGRIVTLAPSNADIVAALDCFDRVVACEGSSEPPAGFESLPRLGPDLNPDLDRIAALSPDLVLSSLSVPGMERVVTGLHVRGIPQLVLAPQTLADVMRDVGRVATALGVAERGEAVVSQMHDEVAALQATRRRPPVRVYLEWWPKPMFTPGADCFSRELIELAGGKNVFGARSGASVQVEAAEIVAADPDICFVSWCGVALDKLDPGNLVARAGLEELRAAREGHVYALDERFSGRPGPRMLEAARRMAAAIAGLPTQ